MSLLSVSKLSSFIEHIFQGTPFSGRFQISHIRYVQQYVGI